MHKRPDIPKVSEVMVRQIKVLGTDFTIFDALSFFNELKISSAPVVNKDSEVVGFLSDSDCLKSIANSLFYGDDKGRTVEQIMQKKLVTVLESEDVFEVENSFLARGLRHAPVVDTNGHMVGVISRRDILASLEDITKKMLAYKKEIKTPIEINSSTRMIALGNRQSWATH